ncbi:MAG: hypothetical protein C0404_04795 [Verrucomicrobia bacterium]|nr:hypothetical protein [Verrucomicrobiota bacterium]
MAMNPAVMRDVFPGQFREREFKAVVLYISAVLIGAAATGLISVAIAGVIGGWGDVSGVVSSLVNCAILVFIAWTCCAAAAEALNPCGKSLAAARLMKARQLYDNGTLDSKAVPDALKVSVDYSRYTIFSLVDIFEHIDKDHYPENYLSLIRHMRRQVEVLIEKGLFEAPVPD